MCGIDDHVDATRLGKCFEGSADFLLQRPKDFIAATIVRVLRVLASALNILFQLFQLIDLCLQRLLIDWRSFRRFPQFVDFSLKRRGPCLRRREIVLNPLKLPFSLATAVLNLAIPAF